ADPRAARVAAGPAGAHRGPGQGPLLQLSPSAPAAKPTPRSCPVLISVAASGDKEGLRADTDLAVEVGEDGRRQARPAGGDDGPGVQADPLPGRLTVQMDGQLRVHETP